MDLPVPVTKSVWITSFSDLHNALVGYRSNAWWMFRGHSDPSWVLKPKAGRAEYERGNDLKTLAAWKRQARGFLDFVPTNDWEWLAVAQHHGLATRLLDWTYNPLSAVWFAIAGDAQADAVVYSYLTTWHWKWNDFTPAECKGIARYLPPAIVPRIARQGGVFTLHGPPTLGIGEQLNPGDKLEAVVIAREYREQLSYELSHYGVNALTQFPDLDGLSRHVNWLWSKRMYGEHSVLVPEQEDEEPISSQVSDDSAMEEQSSDDA